MSYLKTHDWPSIIPIDSEEVNPGALVRHKLYEGSLGTCISRAWGPDDKPMQVTVLWTRYPKGFDLSSVRPVSPGLIASELVKVQPMTMPQGGIFYMDYTYGQDVSGSV